MKKKLFSLFLVLAMVLTILPTAAFAADADALEEGEGIDAQVEDPIEEDEDDNDEEEEPPVVTDKHGHSLIEVEAKDPTCTEAGNIHYWKCTTCTPNKFFFDAEGEIEITSTNYTLSAKSHVRPATSTGYTRDSSTKHSYTCTTCEQTFSEDHTFSNNVCTVCGFERTTPTTPTSPYISITSAYVNSRSIDVNWRSNLPSGTSFEIYVDSNYRRTVSPTSSSGYFSATVYFDHYLNDSYYNVSVRALDGSAASGAYKVYTHYYDNDHYYPSYPSAGPNSTPSTNSSGIPYASQVNGSYSAGEAIRILRNTNSYNLQRDLMNSSSALSSFESLESKVKYYNNVSVASPDVRSGVPSAIRNAKSSVSVTGAAFNASRNSTVRLVLDTPSQTRYTGHGYQFSMTLTGVGGASSLDVPVVVTLPLPSDISSSYVQVLHYHGSGSPTVITPKVSGRTITFPLTGFSDFVITDNAAYYAPGYAYNYGYNYVSDGLGGYIPVTAAGVVGVPAAPRRNLVDEHLQIILPILASMPPSGYVYDDVSGNYWAAAPIAWAKDLGLMSGYFDGTFRPESGTTRQELWMVLARLAGANPADMGAAQRWVVSAGISDGSNPYSPLSTQQMISMLYRYARYRGLDTSAPSGNLAFYRDGAAVSSYARAPMSWAANWGIVVPDGGNCLNPQNIATRADFAVYLYRFLS